MKLRKLSPKLEKATEDYLFSIGSARERLTNEQFHVVAQYVKVRRWQPYIIMSFLMYAILQALLIIWIFRVSKSFVDSAIPSTTKKVVLISSVGEERVPTIVFRNHFMIIP